MGQGGLVSERLAEERPRMPLLDDIPEAMQSLPIIPCLQTSLLLRAYIVFIFSLTFYYESFQAFKTLERYHLIF